MRVKAVEAFRFLNDYVGDLVAGTRSVELFETSPFFANVSDSMRVMLRRMCLSHLVVTLSKWGEVYDRYRDVFPDDVLQPYRDLLKLIRKEAVLANNASWLFRAGPYMIFAATWVAAALVPTFASGLAFSCAQTRGSRGLTCCQSLRGGQSRCRGGPQARRSASADRRSEGFDQQPGQYGFCTVCRLAESTRLR